MSDSLIRHSDNAARPVRIGFWRADGTLAPMGTTAPLPSIEIEHQRIHEGKFYSAGKLWDHTGEIADDALAEILLTTPADVSPHLTLAVAAGGSAELYIYEGADATSGSALTVLNHNRRSSMTSTVAVVSGPTVTTPGTLLEAKLLPGGTGPHAGGGSGQFSSEWVLKYATKYLFRVKNISGSARPVQISLNWYEL